MADHGERRPGLTSTLAAPRRYWPAELGDLSPAVAIVGGIAIAAAFVGILLGTLDFPLNTQAGELAKVDAILGGYNPSYHPILMLQIVRAANAWMAASDRASLAELGRLCAVFAGGITVFASFLLGREVLPRLPALAATVAVAVTPLITVHARYFKEDIFILPFVLLALVALIETLRAPTPMRGVLLGAAIGFAAAAKYIAAIMFPFSVVFLLLGSAVGDRKARLRLVALVTVVAGAVFLLVELPVLWDLSQFHRAVRFELSHALNGHDVRLPISLTYGVFHLRESLLPGLGWPLLTLGLLGLTTPLWAKVERRQALAIIVGFALLWYAIHEISPLKPFPGFVRYAVPLAPVLTILGVAFVRELAERCVPSGSGLLVAIVTVVAAVPALHLSMLINGPAEDDPRSAVPLLIADVRPAPYFDRYTHFDPLDASSAPPDLLVTASFRYERFTRFGSEPHQRWLARYGADYYNALFQLPYLEVTNGRPSFAFFNPVIRIVALDADEDRLESIATRLSGGHPGVLTVRLIDGNERGGPRQSTCRSSCSQFNNEIFSDRYCARIPFD